MKSNLYILILSSILLNGCVINFHKKQSLTLRKVSVFNEKDIVLAAKSNTPPKKN